MITCDNELIGKFLVDKDEAAFETLVQRHGPMVMSVCRTMLRHRQDAEDAFQATFLILAGKIEKLKLRNSIAGWLFHTAINNCRNLRKRDSLRSREQDMTEEPSAKSVEPWQTISDRQQVEQLQLEIDRLPERYRTVVVLCDFQGLSREQAAETLDRTESSIKASLARARKLLRSRLVRRGILMSVLLTAMARTSNAFGRQVSPELVEQTVQLCSAQSLHATATTSSADPASSIQPSDSVIQLVQQGATKMSYSTYAKVGVTAVISSLLLIAPAIVLANVVGKAESPLDTTVNVEGKQEGDSARQESPKIVQEKTIQGKRVPQDSEFKSTRPKLSKRARLLQQIEDIEAKRLDLLAESIQLKIRALDVQQRQVKDEVQKLELRSNQLELESSYLEIRKQQLELKSNSMNAIPPASTARIRPGDELYIEVFDTTGLNCTVKVMADGTINLPLIGKVDTEDQTLESLGKAIGKVYVERKILKESNPLQFVQVYWADSMKPGKQKN